MSGPNQNPQPISKVRVACRNPTLPRSTTVTTAVDKQPACAVTLGGRSGGLLTHSSYTTSGDTTDDTARISGWCGLTH
jgi:hypothetical protein